MESIDEKFCGNSSNETSFFNMAMVNTKKYFFLCGNSRLTCYIPSKECHLFNKLYPEYNKSNNKHK